MSSLTGTYPLTPIDAGHHGSMFVTVWVLEGDIDVEALRGAVTRLTSKWRLLAGRLQSYEGLGKQWRIVVPLGEIPADYDTFQLTASVSDTISFNDHERTTVSPSLPWEQLIAPATPRCNQDWERNKSPLTHWHVTRLRPDYMTGKSRTAIAFSRPHGVFDGTGAALIVRFLVCEMKQQDWTAPSPPDAGYNVNAVQLVLDGLEKAGTVRSTDFAGYSDVGILGVMKIIFNHAKKKMLHNLGMSLVILNIAIVDHLVREVRASLASEGKDAVRVSTGDILTAWLWKVVYAGPSETATHKINCTNLASIRHLLHSIPEMELYPHNAFRPLPYRLHTVTELKDTPLATLSFELAQCRLSLSLGHVLSTMDVFKTAVVGAPIHPDADETIFLANVSSSRILEADWSAVGAVRTLCGYRYSLTPRGPPFTNAIFISGRLPDSSVVLDVTLTRARLQAIETELERLSKIVGVPYVPMD